MYIEIDLATVPPTTTLREAGDFGSLAVVVLDAEHAHIPVDLLGTMVRDHDAGPEAAAQLAGMLAYADSKGWVTDGRVRAHIERR